MAEIIDPNDGEPIEPEIVEEVPNGAGPPAARTYKTNAKPPEEKIEDIVDPKPKTCFVCAMAISTGFLVEEGKPPQLHAMIQTDLTHLGKEAGKLDQVEEFLILGFATIEAIQSKMAGAYQANKKMLDLRGFKFPGGPG